MWRRTPYVLKKIIAKLFKKLRVTVNSMVEKTGNLMAFFAPSTHMGYAFS